MRVAIERKFRTWDGEELFYRHWPGEVRDGRAIVLVHRGHEHSGRWEETVRALGGGVGMTAEGAPPACGEGGGVGGGAGMTVGGAPPAGGEGGGVGGGAGMTAGGAPPAGGEGGGVGDVGGVPVFAWDQRGHGRSPGERGCAPSLMAVVKDFDAFVGHLVREHGVDVRDMVVVGHSVGAVVAAAWAHTFGARIRGLVLATPALEVKLYVPGAVPALRAKLAVFGGGGNGGFVKSYVKSKMLTRDVEQQRAYDADPMIFRQIAVNLLLDLHDAGRKLVADAGAITVPTLVIGAGRDWVVKLGAQRTFYENLGSEVKRFEVFPDMGHAVFHDLGREKVIDLVAGFAGQCFARGREKRTLVRADEGGHTRTEYDVLRSPGAAHWKLQRLFLRTVGRLSDGVRLGWEEGFDSGKTLDYVYLNRSDGRLGLGKVIDRFYLGAIGWRGIRVRGENLKRRLRAAILAAHERAGGELSVGAGTGGATATARAPGQASAGDARVRSGESNVQAQGNLSADNAASVRGGGRSEGAGGGGVHVLDIAAGAGRYVLETVAGLPAGVRVRVTLRDYRQQNLDAAKALAERLGVKDVTCVLADAFDRASLAATRPGVDVAVVSGLYELFPGNAEVRRSLAGVAEAVVPGGTLLYTCQPWHPQVEMIARVLTNREGEPWVMRRRTQAEMDDLTREAGFEKVGMEVDDWGIFTVSEGRKA